MPALGRNEGERQIIKIMQGLTKSQSSWQVWQDFIEMSACQVSSQCDPESAERRADYYSQCVSRYSPEDLGLFDQMWEAMVAEIDRDPEQDFLGNLFMTLDLRSHWKGQFFTPWSVACVLAALAVNEATEERARTGWTIAYDPTCGAGVNLLAEAHELKHRGINFQEHVLFIGQDIDRLTAMMCYIQLSLQGCAGYVILGDTLMNPGDGGLFPEEREGLEYWYTPMFTCSEVWRDRRRWNYVDRVMRSGADRHVERITGG